METPNAAPIQMASLRAENASIVIGLVGFLTLVDLFAAQSILPILAERFDATPSGIGLAANASTFGMAVAGFAVVFLGRRVDRRAGIVASLAALTLPTLLLGFVDDLTLFAVLRIFQGLLMATAFSLTMTYLAENRSAPDTASALAAYVTGSVAANLVGRLTAATIAQYFGVSIGFAFFAALNLAGAALVFATFRGGSRAIDGMAIARAPLVTVKGLFRNACLRTSFAIGFLILFAFIGAFTYVNFALAQAPLSLSPMALGLVYLVLAPSMVTTPIAGKVAARFGARIAFLVSIAVAILGALFLTSMSLPAVLTGLALFAIGTFFAQATATGFVSRAATHDRAAASGAYLAFYYLGGLVGAAVIGRVFESMGWTATVAAIVIVLLLCGACVLMLKRETANPARSS
jgi:predicted MFS family arabinose efflux permease